MSTTLTTQALLSKSDIQKRFEDLLGEKAQGFISSILQIVNSSNHLAAANPTTVLNAAATAAALDLPINKDLGFAYIVPYKGNAQFQLGYKGLIQLAHRTGKYTRLNSISIDAENFVSWDPFYENLILDYDKKPKGEIVGYAAIFKMNNGFSKTEFWPLEKVKTHGKKYSKAYTSGPWNTNFDAMAKKTVLKSILNRWGELSIEMQTAISADQSIQYESGKYSYDDNPKNAPDLLLNDEQIEKERIEQHIKDATTLEKLQQVRELVSMHGLGDTYEEKESDLMNGINQNT